jgi:hypothetical protein
MAPMKLTPKRGIAKLRYGNDKPPAATRHLISTVVPLEVLWRIFSYLHPPEKDCWTSKHDLKVVSLTCRKLREAVMADFFRDLTLKFTYAYDWQGGRSGWCRSWCNGLQERRENCAHVFTP